MVDRLKINQAEERHQLRKEVAALKAENERLEIAKREAIAGWKDAERALAERAGGVKVPIGYALVPVEPTDRMVSAYVAAKPKGAGFNHPRKGDDKKAWFAAHEKKCRERWKAMLSVSALTTEPAAPEGQQPVAGAVRVCPVRDAICPHGMGCLYNDGMDCDMEASRADLAYQKHAASYTRPAEQAVTEAMVEAAARAMCAPFPPDETIYLGRYYKRWETHMESAALALKAAMEAGRHD